MTFRDPFAEGEWYHCYNRGVDKRIIFKNRSDYERFLMLLYIANSAERIHISDLLRSVNKQVALAKILDTEKGQPLVVIGAYSFMPNHFHIMFKAIDSKQASLFMQKVATGYSMYFNKKYKRTGTLFESKFKSKRVDSDQYFKRLLNYIHANAAELYEPGWKKGIIKNENLLRSQLAMYTYSSLPEYLKKPRQESKIINTVAVTDLLEMPYAIDDLFEEARMFAQTTDVREVGPPVMR